METEILQIIIEVIILIALVYIARMLAKIAKCVCEVNKTTQLALFSGGGSQDGSGTGGGRGPRGILSQILEVTKSIKEDTATIAASGTNPGDKSKP